MSSPCFRKVHRDRQKGQNGGLRVMGSPAPRQPARAPAPPLERQPRRPARDRRPPPHGLPTLELPRRISGKGSRNGCPLPCYIPPINGGIERKPPPAAYSGNISRRA